jgi:hypothetical protein
VVILERYISRITVGSVLGAVLANRKLMPYEIDGNNVLSVVEDVMIGLRLFCAEDKLPDLMLDLADFCDREAFMAQGPPSRRSASVPRVAVG